MKNAILIVLLAMTSGCQDATQVDASTNTQPVTQQQVQQLVVQPVVQFPPPPVISTELHDADGTLLHTTGLAIAVPGQVFVAADSEVESSPFGRNSKPGTMQRLTEAPDELSFSFEAQDVQSVESGN